MLEDERWGPTERETHLNFVDSEVADDWSAFVGFLHPERALWQALRAFHPSDSTKYRLDDLNETLELGDMITTRFFDGRRRTYHAAIQALCDLAARTMVFEKSSSMQSLAHEAGARAGAAQGP